MITALLIRLRDFLNARFPEVSSVPEEPAPPALEPEVLVHCAKCPNTTLQHRIRPVDMGYGASVQWFVESPAQIIQGKTIGLCPVCRFAPIPVEGEEEEEHDHDFDKCQGDTDTGVYYKAESSVFFGETHACYVYECVEHFLEKNAEHECSECGSEVSWSVYQYEGPKRLGRADFNEYNH